jgi:hypothetical protein
VPKIIDYNKKFLYATFLKSLFASILMAGWIIIFEPKINFLILIPLGAIIYALVMYIIGGFKTRDVVIVYEALVKKLD